MTDRQRYPGAMYSGAIFFYEFPKAGFGFQNMGELFVFDGICYFGFVKE
jgi:hypothetical protein